MKRLLGPDYCDILVCDFLKYGFHIGFKGGDVENLKLDSWKYKNHSGAYEFPNEIENYLGKESKDYRILSPFMKIHLKVSPLNLVPKKDTSERRVTLDVCMPKGHAVNDFIEKDWLVKAKVPGCLLFKKDLKKAYRQISICPKITLW
ncbi:hypothetical protein MAR_018912 [Mya arenaria]|uniref:Reverse transcriptase domain-containing protein n=1 Tax=Mya arenaria TaxID=6604 RepID=A0ABY7EII4_MYAAR|nr:hypothetical protein MAR_018912 [Mya arenaria]